MTDWDIPYRDQGAEGVPWFEEVPQVSLDLIEAAGLGPGTAAVDVGAGLSRLAGHLLARGFEPVMLLDLSPLALARASAALPKAAPVETWVGSVLDWVPERPYRLWHDRAAFHFLTDAEEQARYLRVLRRTLAPGGVVVLAGFAEDGPERCSGQPVMRRSPADLAEALGSDFAVEATRRHLHRTPAGAEQPFAYLLARRG